MEKRVDRSPAPQEDLTKRVDLVLPYLPPRDLASAAGACRSLRRAAAGVTARRAANAARGMEPHPIRFTNSVDPHLYSYFFYTPRSIVSLPSSFSQPWGGAEVAATDINRSAMLNPYSASGIEAGCDCNECELSSCPCWKSNRLQIECGNGCNCGLDCGNRVTQRGIRVLVRIERDRRKGWGLHAMENIKQGLFVCEYSGEYLTTEEARKQQRIYDELSSKGKISPALIVLREHLPSGKACLRVNIDATRIGNVARFINHSCDGGNLNPVLVRNQGSILPRLCFFAGRDISVGEELSFSYGEARVRANGLPCFCGSSNCLGLLPSEET